jgi:hypothetical protein
MKAKFFGQISAPGTLHNRCSIGSDVSLRQCGRPMIIRYSVCSLIIGSEACILIGNDGQSLAAMHAQSSARMHVESWQGYIVIGMGVCILIGRWIGRYRQRVILSLGSDEALSHGRSLNSLNRIIWYSVGPLQYTLYYSLAQWIRWTHIIWHSVYVRWTISYDTL